MEKISLDNIPENHQVRTNDPKDNSKLKIWILSFLLFVTLIMVSSIISDNYFNISNQSKIHLNSKIVNINCSNEKTDDTNSNIEINTRENVNRVLADTQINSWIYSDQRYPKVSALSDGNFVVTWQSFRQNGNRWSINGQIFYSNGAKKGNEFLINNSTTLNQTNPIIAASSGKFMVGWQQGSNTLGQIFLNDGAKLNNQFQINEAPGSSSGASIATLKNSNFVVFWDNYTHALSFQILTDNGTKVDSQKYISTAVTLSSTSVASLANGNFVVTYLFLPNFYANIFYSNGTMLKSMFKVNTNSASNTRKAISSISNSNFLIVWESQGLDVIAGTVYGIFGQRFTSSGVPIGNEFRISTYTKGTQKNPSIASFANDNYIVTWESNNQDRSGLGIYGQILDGSGNKIGSEFKVNTFISSDQALSSVTSLLNTNFVVVWESNSQDTSGWGVFGNIYQSNGSVVSFYVCPLNCQSCINSTHCISCNPNFKLNSNGLCECFDGFYLDNITISTCISKFIILNIKLIFTISL